MDKKLFVQALCKFFIGAALCMALVFLPAGTLRFPGGWLFMAVLFVPMFVGGLVMMAKCPELLRKRLDAKEKEGEQKFVVIASGMIFILCFVTAGLNFRFGWLALPKGVTIGACVVFLLSYVMYGEVLRENEYLSRTIEVQKDQKVVDTGLYGVVRHPMYTATILMFLAIPLILGSLPSFLILLLYPALIVKRIGNEEKVLEDGLKGYSEYKQKVKYRLVPFIW